MAGRVERRINDRFYFVLDEIGASSDVESDNESKSSKKTGVENITKAGQEEEVDAQVSIVGNKDANLDEDKGNEVNEEKMTFDSVDSSTDEGTKTDSDKPSTSTDDELAAVKTSGTQPAENTVDMDIDSEGEVDSDSTETNTAPLMKITFRDESSQELYKNCLIKFLSQRIKPCTVVTSSENHLEIEIYEKHTEEMVQDDVLDFELDTMPDYNLRNSRVPYYGKAHDIVLSDKKDKNGSNKVTTSTGTCFNCMGNHNLRDCPEPRDFRVINRNRNKFQSAVKAGKTRYHLDENQKFSHIVPGQFSKKLRSALNLHKDEQPGFIYRMRLLGYPPAWLEEARVSYSGVALYDSKGEPVLDEDEEEGEILAEGAKDKYDISKIIEFPGFNVPLPKNMKDDYKMHHCPQMSEEQSKESLIKKLQPNAVQAYKRKSFSTEKSTPTPNSTPKEPLASIPRLPSPTIEEMEARKKALLMALDEEETTSDSKLSQDDAPSSNQDSETVPSTPVKELGSVKNFDLGTPVLKSVSPFSKLPTREQFSVNVSDVINFENLPNSTGKYETMSDLIMKIRSTVNKDSK